MTDAIACLGLIALAAIALVLVNLLAWMFRERKDFGWGVNRPSDAFQSDRRSPHD
jgi:hypothetical protein